MTMSARTIVERRDVVGDVSAGGVAIPVDLLLDSLFLQTAEEGLRYGVVPAIATTTHAGFQPIRFAEAPPCVATVLRALVRMDQRLTRSSAAHGHQHSIEHELSMKGCSRRPTDNAS